MRLSSRVPADPPNDLAEARLAASERGQTITELTDSNPTRHGLLDPAVMDVVARHLGEARRYEPDPRGWRPAREALAARFGGSPDDYWLTASTSEAYSWLFAVLADPGDAVAIPVPGYPLVEPLARLSGLRTVPYRSVYLDPHGWELDLNSVAAIVELVGTEPAETSVNPPPHNVILPPPNVILPQAGPRALIAVNPNNPTGAYVRPDQGAVLGAMCAAAALPIIADEVFFPFLLDDSLEGDAPVRLADSVGPEAVVVTLDGLSKLLAAPQLKLGWIRLSGPRELTGPLADALDVIADTYLSVNSPVGCALPELLNLVDVSVERIRSRCAENLRMLGFLGDGFRVRRTQGGWTVLVDVPKVVDDDALARRLLDAGLAAHPGWFYDVADEGCLALSLLPEPASFADALQRLTQTIRVD